jgi:excinuclease ABC subunit B
MQTCGRAARNANGLVILFADKVTAAMKYCIDETTRRRAVQQEYNEKNGIVPQTIIKQLPALFLPGGDEKDYGPSTISEEKLNEVLGSLKAEMETAATRMEFEKAAMIRDEIIALQEEHLELGVLAQLGKALKKGRAKGVAKKRQMRDPGNKIARRKPKAKK